MIPENSLRLLIIDDHAVVREGLEAMLGADLGIGRIATAASTEEALPVCESLRPHVVLLDLRMPGSDGFNALEIIHQRWPEIHVLILSASATVAEVRLARRNGAAGYLSKSADRATLMDAIRTVAAGGLVFSPDPSPVANACPSLSARELEVLRHLGRGLSREELGQALGISAETVKSHIKAIFHKLGVTDRAEAIARAYDFGLLSAER
ncbi:MAG: response regulator transcription factor [Akkermansiaceae bacterium]